MRCPVCGMPIEVRQTHYPYFVCPGCKSALCVPTVYRIKGLLLGEVTAFCICYLLGLRGMALILAVFLLGIIVAGTVTFVGMVIVPPKIERYWQPGSLGLK